jgi:hypothetical protein
MNIHAIRCTYNTNLSIIIKKFVNLINLMNMISSSWAIYIHERNSDSDYSTVRTSNKIKVCKATPVLSARK